MQKQKVGYFLAGLIIGAVVFSSSMAQAWTSQVTIDFIPLNYFFNGVQKYTPSDQQGFIYNGSTYVPLRFMAEASGQTVDWDGNTNSIYVGGGSNSLTDNTAGQYFSDILKPYYNEIQDIWVNDGDTVAGKTYYHNFSMQAHGMNCSFKTSFNLSGRYSSITGLIGLSDSNNGNDNTILVYGDDNLIKKYELKAGCLPQKLDIDVSGVTKLDFEIVEFGWSDRIVLCDPIIK